MTKNFIVIVGFAGNAAQRIGIGKAAPAKVSLATIERWKDSAGHSRERTDWHTVLCWERLADVAVACVRKGEHVLVCGSLRSRQYEDTGRTQTIWEVHARELVMLDPIADHEVAGPVAPPSGNA